MSFDMLELDSFDLLVRFIYIYKPLLPGMECSGSLTLLTADCLPDPSGMKINICRYNVWFFLFLCLNNIKPNVAIK
jgi:hypothetical protein